jgi:DNA repair protein RadD
MTLSLRPYQRSAIDALYNYFAEHSGNPLVVIPTGGGKSLCIAGFIREAIESYAMHSPGCSRPVRSIS